MQLFSIVAVVILTTYSAQGLKSSHGVVKRDLSEADVEMILKALMSKMEHSKVDSELIHKKVGVDREHYLYEPEVREKVHLSGVRGDEVKYLSKSHPLEHEYVKEEVPLEKDYERKKELSANEKDMMALMMKIKELNAAKDLEDSYKKEMYETSEEKFLAEKAHLSKDPAMMGKSEKMFGDIVQEDKFNDKDVSLAESLYHMKIAGDIETYPSYKLEPLHDKKMGEEKLLQKDHAGLKVGADEAYLKKVDEIGKSLMKEETYPYFKEDLEGYLKKAAEEEKAHFEPKIAHSEAALKTAEEKDLETWKASHKDLFVAEGGFHLDEKLKAEGVHHAEKDIAHGISDELMKKLKEEGVFHVEGGIAHGISDELMKKLKEEGVFHVEGGIAHGISDELMKKLKEEGVFHVEGGIAHGISDELMKKLKEEGVFHVEEGIAHGISDELLKKLKEEGVYHVEEGIAHGLNDELIKKLKALGMDKELGKEHDELLHHLSKELNKEAGIEGSFAYEKAKEQAHKDAHVYLSEEEMKKHIEEALAHGAKEKVHGTEFQFEKGLGEEKIHGINSKGAGMEKSLHEIMAEEALKSKDAHGFDQSFGYSKDKAMFGGKFPLEGEIKHSISHGAEAEKAFKAHQDELLKKEKAFEADSLHHKTHEAEILKEKAYGIDSFLHKAHEEERLKKEKAHATDELHKAFEDELLKKEKSHGTDAFFHKAHEEELLKKEKTYGTDAFLHKAHEDELIKKEIAYGADPYVYKVHEDEVLKKAHGADAHKFHEDELIKKEVAYGSDSFFHKNKEILGAADHHLHHGIKEEAGVLHGITTDKHHIEAKEGITGAEKSHKTFRDLKAKFFELLRRVLHTRKCHLVTMRPGELLSIVNCISRSKDPLLCEKFTMCEKKMPIRVIANLEKCQKETIPEEAKKCTTYAPLYPTTEIPLKIFQCVAISTGELKQEEKKHMIDFEECARVIKAESCGRFKFFPRPH